MGKLNPIVALGDCTFSKNITKLKKLTFLLEQSIKNARNKDQTNVEISLYLCCKKQFKG